MRRITLLVVMAVAAAACLGNDFEDSLNGSWQLVSGEVEGKPVPIIESHPITLIIGEDAVGGTAGCNNYYYAGSLPVSEGQSFGVTEMACSPPETMEAESLYLDGLSKVNDVELGSTNLTLTGSGVTLEFEPLAAVPIAEMLGTVWVLTGLIKDGTVTSVSGERATLELFTDGSFIGSTGCRDVSGSYIVSGPNVQFTNWGAHGECPSELTDQDSHVISALEGGFRVEIEEDQMTTWVAGDEGLIYHSDS